MSLCVLHGNKCHCPSSSVSLYLCMIPLHHQLMWSCDTLWVCTLSRVHILCINVVCILWSLAWSNRLVLFIHVYVSVTLITNSFMVVLFMTAETPFNRESLVTTYALYRLERRGVQVRREISTKNRDFQAVLRMKQPDANLAMIKWGEHCSQK